MLVNAETDRRERDNLMNFERDDRGACNWTDERRRSVCTNNNNITLAPTRVPIKLYFGDILTVKMTKRDRIAIDNNFTYPLHLTFNWLRRN